MFHKASSPIIAVFLLAAATQSNGETPQSDPAAVETAITGNIADGTPGPPPPETEPIRFKVAASVTKRVHVLEAPEMPGLPAPEGTINVTVQLVKDPGLPDPPPPLPDPVPENPAVTDGLAESHEEDGETRLVFVSATVCDHSRTFLRCHGGGPDGKEIGGWSNLDFNHFSGFGTYQVKGADGVTRSYGLMMAIGDEGITDEGPELPDLATSGPAFVITEGDTNDVEAVQLIEGMHDLYRMEGQRMEEAYHARVKAYEERKAYLLAHPPKPKDVNVSFWNRDHPLRQTPAPGMEGGIP